MKHFFLITIVLLFASCSVNNNVSDYIASPFPALPPARPITYEDCIDRFVPPEFEQGYDYNKLLKFIDQNTNYPESAKKDSIRMSVDIDFWVETDLTTSGYEVVESKYSISKNKNKNIDKKVREDLYNEALRVAKLITYKNPACEYGKPIRYKTGIVVYFRLD